MAEEAIPCRLGCIIRLHGVSSSPVAALYQNRMDRARKEEGWVVYRTAGVFQLVHMEEIAMQSTKLSRRGFLRSAALLGVSAITAACAPQVVKETVVVEKQVEKVVKETVVVKEEVQKEVTKIVEKVVEKQVAAPKQGVMLRLGKSSGASRDYASRAPSSSRK